MLLVTGKRVFIGSTPMNTLLDISPSNGSGPTFFFFFIILERSLARSFPRFTSEGRRDEGSDGLIATRSQKTTTTTTKKTQDSLLLRGSRKAWANRCWDQTEWQMRALLTNAFLF